MKLHEHIKQRVKAAGVYASGLVMWNLWNQVDTLTLPETYYMI